MRLTLLSPERRLINDAEVQTVSLTGSEGQIQIMPGHASLLGSLVSGSFSYQMVGKELTTGFISTGFFEVNEDQVVVTAETVELQSEIDPARAREAQLKAEKILQDASLAPDHFRKYQLKLQRALIRQQLSEKTH